MLPKAQYFFHNPFGGDLTSAELWKSEFNNNLYVFFGEYAWTGARQNYGPLTVQEPAQPVGLRSSQTLTGRCWHEETACTRCSRTAGR